MPTKTLSQQVGFIVPLNPPDSHLLIVSFRPTAPARCLLLCWLCAFKIPVAYDQLSSDISASAMPDTPPDSNFMPRKEFLRDQPRTANAFSLMTISGSSFIRMYSFPAALIATLRRLFDQLSLVTAFREDVPQGLYEFTLDGKPWSSPKSVNSERLILQLLTVIYQYGYSFLSTIDYGREHDDRLAMAFSKPRSPSPSPRSSSPMGNVSQSSQDRPVKKIPFALSFPSATLLRVINPPLHMTPAILQAVRGSWPRGVVSEKKIGDASYEFKLKGYRCKFQSFHEMFSPSKCVDYRVPRGHIRERFPSPYSNTPFFSGYPFFFPSRFSFPVKSLACKRSLDLYWFSPT